MRGALATILCQLAILCALHMTFLSSQQRIQHDKETLIMDNGMYFGNNASENVSVKFSKYSGLDLYHDKGVNPPKSRVVSGSSIPKDKMNRQKDKGLKVILLTSYRSGSSFVGETLKIYPDVFYMFEPLMFYTLDGFETAAKMKYINDHFLEILEKLLSCSVVDLISDSIQLFSGDVYDKKRENWIRRTFPHHDKSSLEDIEAACKRKPHIVIKLIRAHNLEAFLPLLLDESLRIIHLVRDPRGVVNSIRTLDKSINKDHQYFDDNVYKETGSIYCRETLDNLSFLKGNIGIPSLKAQYRLIRYEDFAYRPMTMTKRLYTYLGFKFTSHTKKTVYATTHILGRSQSDSKVLNPYGTQRNAEQVVIQWFRTLPPQILEYVHQECSKLLKIIGYRKPKVAEKVKLSLKMLLYKYPHTLPGIT